MLVQDDGVDIVHGDIANDADSLDFIVGVADIGALSDGARFEYDLTYAGHIITVSYYPSGRPAGWTEVRFGTGFGVFECSSCATAVDAGRGRAIGIVPIEAWDALVADLDDRARRPRSPAFGPGAQFSSITLNTGRVSMEPSGVDPASNGVTNARPSDPYPNLDSAAAPPGAVWTAS